MSKPDLGTPKSAPKHSNAPKYVLLLLVPIAIAIVTMLLVRDRRVRRQDLVTINAVAFADPAAMDAAIEAFEVRGSDASVLLEIKLSERLQVRCGFRQLVKYRENGRLSQLMLTSESMDVQSCAGMLKETVGAAMIGGVANADVVAEKLDSVQAGRIDPCRTSQLGFGLLGSGPRHEITLRCDRYKGNKVFFVWSIWPNP